MRISDWSSDVCSSDLFTDRPVDEIARLESLEGAEINEAKIILANEATAMCRGFEAAEAAAETARQTFALGGAGENLPTLGVPEGVIGVIDALIGLGFASSKGEARRKIAEGAVRIDGEPVKDAEHRLHIGSSPTKVSLGKKRHGMLSL